MMTIYRLSPKSLMTRSAFLRRRNSSLAIFLLCCHTSSPAAAFSTLSSFSTAGNTSVPSKSTHIYSTFCPRASQRLKHRLFGSKLNIDEVLASETTHLPRLYVENLSLAEQTLITLSPFQSNYLHVMRLSNGKRWGEWAGYVRLFNGNNGEWLAKMVVTETSTPQKRRRRQNKSNADNTILECLQQTKLQPSERLSSVHLHMGRLKKQRRKWVLEKITELGISSIEVVDTEYATTTDAWEFEKHCIQVIEAAEQCERLTIPKLSQAPIAWSDLITSIKESKSDQHWLVCRERCPELTEPILFALREINENRKGDDLQRNIHILVGPEGGWSPGELEELSFLREAEKNLRFVSLGPLVLRAETAAISAVAATVLSGDQID